MGKEGATDDEGERTISLKEQALRDVSQYTIYDLFDTNRPWVLVKDGSLVGFFDFVPTNLRTGPWSAVAIPCYLTLTYLAVLGAAWTVHHGPEHGWGQELNASYEGTFLTPSWCYNALVFAWTSFMCWHILHHSPAGGMAWASFTVQSWTLITIRHGLCAMAPFIPSFGFWAELIRFPVLVSSTQTFVVWNFVLMPVLLFFAKTREDRRKRLKVFTNFRMTQVHVCNIIYATVNAALSYPRRRLNQMDLVLSLVHPVFYTLWYYLILDRFGVHLYPMFSPRTPLVVLCWILMLLSNVVFFRAWSNIINTEKDILAE